MYCTYFANWNETEMERNEAKPKWNGTKQNEIEQNFNESSSQNLYFVKWFLITGLLIIACLTN